MTTLLISIGVLIISAGCARFSYKWRIEAEQFAKQAELFEKTAMSKVETISRLHLEQQISQHEKRKGGS